MQRLAIEIFVRRSDVRHAHLPPSLQLHSSKGSRSFQTFYENRQDAHYTQCLQCVRKQRLWPLSIAAQKEESASSFMAEGQSKAEYDQRWHDAWQQGVPPGRKWDVGKPAPALIEFLDSGFLPVEGKTAYVPGCGRGYDPVELARRGAYVTGLDLAPESVEEAQRYLQSQDMSSIAGSIQFVSGDYFTYRTDTPWVDVGYDFTFMCALHPSLRNDWARTWTKVMKSGGYLIALEYPIRPDDKSGPPWPVSPQIYADLLIPLGFKNVYYKDVDQALLSHPRLPGAEVIACFQKL